MEERGERAHRGVHRLRRGLDDGGDFGSARGWRSGGPPAMVRCSGDAGEDGDEVGDVGEARGRRG